MQNSSLAHSVVSWGIALVLFSCSAGYEARAMQRDEDGNHANEGSLIDIVGFNYTNRTIDSFSVDGQGGGNVFLSSRTSGGGKSACCVRLPRAHSSGSRVHVRWQVDGCTYLTKSRISGEVFENIFPYYREAYVDVIHRDKSDPQHLEIHFYPSGTVLAQLTATLSPPRILLDGRRADKSHFPRCRDDKKPE